MKRQKADKKPWEPRGSDRVCSKLSLLFTKVSKSISVEIHVPDFKWFHISSVWQLLTQFGCARWI